MASSRFQVELDRGRKCDDLHGERTFVAERAFQVPDMGMWSVRDTTGSPCFTSEKFHA
jgi:hypothetical protein